MKFSTFQFYENLSSKLPLIGIIFCFFMMCISIFNLYNNILGTISTMLFGFSLFSLLGIIYFLVGKKTSSGNNFEAHTNCKTVTNYAYVLKLLQIIYYLIIVFIYLILNNSGYAKPNIYYILISLATVTIGLQVGLKKQFDEKDIFTILFLQILPLAIIIRSSSLFLSPFNVGIDTVKFHYPKIQQIIATYHLHSSSFHYYYFPSYHLIQAVSGIIVGFSIYNFKIIHVSNSIVSILIAYLIGKELFDVKTGLMFALLLSIATMQLFLVTYSTSKIGGVTLLLIDIYLLLLLLRLLNIRHIILFFICTITLFLWHPEIGGALLFILLAYSITKRLSNHVSKSDSLLLPYAVSFIAYYMFVSTFLFNHIVSSIFFENISNVPILAQKVNVTGGFIFQSFASYIGITLPSFFAVYTILCWLNRSNSKKLFITFCIFSLCLIPIFGLLSHNYGLSPERLLTYISIFFILTMSCSVFDIFKLNNNRSVFLFMFILFFFTIFSTSSYVVADGNDFYNDHLSVDIIYKTEPNIATNYFISTNTPTDCIINSDRSTICTLIIDRKTYMLPNFSGEGYFWIICQWRRLY